MPIPEMEYPLRGGRIELDNESTAWWPCHIGRETKIGHGVNIGAMAHVGSHVEIGDGVRIQGGAFIGDSCIIGDDVFIGPNATLLNDLYPPSPDKETWLPCVVKSGGVVGGNATINPGVIVGRDAVVASGAVAIRDVPEGEVWGGVPARFLMTREEYERRRERAGRTGLVMTSRVGAGTDSEALVIDAVAERVGSAG